MSAELTSLAWRVDLPPSRKLLLVWYASQADETGSLPKPTTQETIQATGLSRMTVWRCHKALLQHSLITDDEARSIFSVNYYGLVECITMIQSEPEMYHHDTTVYHHDTNGTDEAEVECITMIQSEPEMYHHDTSPPEHNENNNNYHDSDRLIDESVEEFDEPLDLFPPPPSFEEPSVNSQPRNGRVKSQRQLILGELEHHFCDRTGLPPPPRDTEREKRASAVRWWQPLWVLYSLSQNVMETKSLITDTVAHMREQGLTIAAPQSIANNALDLFARNRVPQGEATIAVVDGAY